jgi:beta-lactamase class A
MHGVPRRRIRLERNSFLITSAALLVLAMVLSACSRGDASKTPPAVAAAPAYESPTFAAQVTPIITPIPTATSTPTPLPTATPNGYWPETAEQTATNDLLGEQSGVYGFVVMEASGHIVSSYNSRTPFVTASTYKVVLMADILKRIEKGELSLDQQIWLDPALFDKSGGDMYFLWSDANTSKPISELLYAVGAWSSNVSALTLLTLTTPDALNETAHEIGMEQTYLFANPTELPYWPPQPGVDSSQEDIDAAMAYILDSYAEEGWVNLTTPYDMATYNLGLINGTVVSPWVSEQIVDILLDNAIRDRLPAYLWDIPVADKPGNLVGVVNDTGILFLDSGARAVAAYSEAVPDDAHATEILALLGLIAAGNTDI